MRFDKAAPKSPLEGKSRGKEAITSAAFPKRFEPPYVGSYKDGVGAISLCPASLLTTRIAPIPAQTILSGFVERDRFLEFRFCGGSESRVDFRKSLRRPEKTFPASRAFSLCD